MLPGRMLQRHIKRVTREAFAPVEEKLSNKKCVPCEGGISPFSLEDLFEYQKQVHEDWRVADEGKKIKRDFSFADFKEAMAFVNKVADIAETESHHPDITISYNKVVISLWTHAIGGLSENDFIMAAKIDELG
jgi:4a-hydroxytetrahydrobiopterin dehydratase